MKLKDYYSTIHSRILFQYLFKKLFHQAEKIIKIHHEGYDQQHSMSSSALSRSEKQQIAGAWISVRYVGGTQLDNLKILSCCIKFQLIILFLIQTYKLTPFEAFHHSIDQKKIWNWNLSQSFCFKIPFAICFRVEFVRWSVKSLENIYKLFNSKFSNAKGDFFMNLIAFSQSLRREMFIFMMIHAHKIILCRRKARRVEKSWKHV